MLERAGFNDRADKHLGQTAAHGVYHRAYDYPRERVGEKLGEKRKPDKSHGGHKLRADNASSVADLIGEFCTQNIDDELCNEKDR